MHSMLRVSFLFLSALFFLSAPGIAGDKPPSPYDESRMGAVPDGRQNYPFTLRGVTIKWDIACNKGSSADCLKLGKAFESGFGAIEADLRAAVGYYMLACKRGAGEGCARAAAMLNEGTPGYKLPDLARQQAEIGCTQLRYQQSCASLATSRAMAAGPGSSGGETLLAQACSGGDDMGCRIRANTLFYQRGDAASRGEAIRLFEPACKARKAWGCMGMADAYANGWGVARDAARAFEYQRTGCIDSSGDKLRLCTLYGTALTNSSSTRDLNLGEQILNASCSANDGLACYRLGRIGFDAIQGATTTTQEALYYSRRGCELGQGGACAWLGAFYAVGNTSVKAVPEVGIALLDRGCSLGEASACHAARKLLAADPQLRGRIPAIDPAAPAAVQLKQAQRAVESGNWELGLPVVARLTHEGNEDAEWLLGGWMYYGQNGLFDSSYREQGLILFENAARVGHVDAAIFMGMAYWYGDGVNEDRGKGQRYMDIAASRGSKMAAAILRSMQAEPIRQENARRQKEYEEWQASRQAEWSSSWSNYVPSWSPPSSSYNPTPTGKSISQIYDEANFNNAINYYSGATSVCAYGNRYC